MISRRGLAGLAGALSIPALLPRSAQAQSWPTRPVTMVVPWAAGGGSDTVTRIFATGLEAELGQPVNVVNRTGGNGIVGHAAIANAAPDGYTIGCGTSELVNFKVLGQSDLGPQNFDLISRIAVIPAGVTVKADGDWKDFKSFAAALKGAPKGKFTGSGVSTGGSWHLAAAGLAKAMGMEVDTIRWIPSQGGAPALQDLVAGGISVFTGSPIEAKPLADAGQVRVLAVMAEERMSSFPDVPTLRELGVDWTYLNWFSLVTPKGLPAPVRQRLIEAAAKGHARPEVRNTMKQRGIVPVWETPEHFQAYVTDFAKTTSRLLNELGLARG
ncbi:tripartite tricarboxylate transporter substrate binding protein [Roseomonas sp. M0104]|uniref:Tripartite tricarboxylate transporter substrate binding protein n=1 Tax=Teichococcus coralli TaxID=2545983 RepID=A0A845B8K1_9PROT|nr:tripartite tricarboxylate transporter substrate binding protein [Pseudoroseomonas coralli]MXP63501.1 tripartite tricarboxylate transporter substrate binding protein [Pseudoroseomonas coralli]